MRYVLDTCTFFWLADDQTKLSEKALRVIGDRANSLHVPIILLTELHRLIRKGRISIQSPGGLDNWFRKALIQHEAQYEPLTIEIAQAAEILPRIHNDPADRFILATAQVLDARVLSPDAILPKYPGGRVDW